MLRSYALALQGWQAAAKCWDAGLLGDRNAVTLVIQPGSFRSVLLPPGGWWDTRFATRIVGGEARTVLHALGEAPLH